MLLNNFGCFFFSFPFFVNSYGRMKWFKITFGGQMKINPLETVVVSVKTDEVVHLFML